VRCRFLFDEGDFGALAEADYDARGEIVERQYASRCCIPVDLDRFFCNFAAGFCAGCGEAKED